MFSKLVGITPGEYRKRFARADVRHTPRPAGLYNQQANVVDLHVVLENPVSSTPVPGAMIKFIGEITSYTPEPFLFTMEQGKIGPAVAPAHP